MESGKINLAELFEAEKFYAIPDFQRPFSWDEDQFVELIDDLLAADHAKEYFLGTVVFYIDNGTRMVVDGQQRLTSLMVLLACLRDLFEKKDFIDGIQRLIVQPEDVVREIDERDRLIVKNHVMYRKLVVSTGGTTAEYDPRDFDEPENRYVIARNVFVKAIKPLDQNELATFLKFLSNRCLLVFLQANTFDEAFRLFEVVNDRGKQLRRIDLLKSHNLAAEYVPQETKRKQLANQWEQDEASVGEATFESIFNIMRLMYVKDKPQEDLFSEFRKRIFSAGSLGRGEQFFSKVSSLVDLYRQIFIDRSYLDGEPYEKQFSALIFIMNNELATFEWRACVLAYADKFGRSGFYDFVLALEKLVLAHLVDGVRKDERYSDYVAVLRLIDKEKTGPAVRKGIYVDETSIKNKLENDEVYKKNYARYVLLRLELATAEHSEIRTFTARSIEHVFPQNPEPGGAWDALAVKADRDKFVHKLGNLVLLSKGKNSSAGNKEFADKKTTYLGPRVSDYPRSGQVCGYNSWDKATIDERTSAAAELVLKDPATK